MRAAAFCFRRRFEMAAFRPVVVIPVYNHGPSALRVMDAVRAHGLPVIVIDDGSQDDCAKLLDAAGEREGVHLVRLPFNQGKGGAVIAGLQRAILRGHTHALQIDADGQHDTADIPDFIARGCADPEAVICGTPIYDASVPTGRLVGRYATHVWVWINTVSLGIRDSLCGFRLYPLASTGALLEEVRLGRRMDFDTEILVRLHWRGVRIVNRPTRVTYPRGGVSHFRLWQDNWLISRMHAKLFAGMLLRLPLLLARKVAR
jgi:glycosyltransferase involved in cell wall biosynthesis